MKFASLAKFTLVDFPGRVSATVFTTGCNYRCPFCHNPELVDVTLPPQIDEEDVLDFLRRRKGRLKGLCITGGEPTLWGEELMGFIEKVKALGFAVKLDTNGSNPDFLLEALRRGLLDYVAMDVKSSPDKYHLAIGLGRDQTEPILEAVKRSISILMDSDIPYEFRTTAVPGYVDMEDIPAIGQMIKGARLWAVQRYHKDKVLKPEACPDRGYDRQTLEEMARVMSDYVQRTEVRW